MTGGSLGLRQSGSCGSLQLHAQNGGFQLQNLYLPRRSSKTCLAGYREKEKFLPATFRYLSRKKVAMLILSVFAVLAFLTGFFTVNKGRDRVFLVFSCTLFILHNFQSYSYLIISCKTR